MSYFRQHSEYVVLLNSWKKNRFSFTATTERLETKQYENSFLFSLFLFMNKSQSKGNDFWKLHWNVLEKNIIRIQTVVISVIFDILLCDFIYIQFFRIWFVWYQLLFINHLNVLFCIFIRTLAPGSRDWTNAEFMVLGEIAADAIKSWELNSN